MTDPRPLTRREVVRPEPTWRVHVMRAQPGYVTTSTHAHRVDGFGHTSCGMRLGGAWLPAAVSATRCEVCEAAVNRAAAERLGLDLPLSIGDLVTNDAGDVKHVVALQATIGLALLAEVNDEGEPISAAAAEWYQSKNWTVI
jgi:hypothetical protein